MTNKQIVNFNASKTKPVEGKGVKGTLYFITDEEKSYLCTDPSTLVPMDGSVKNISIDVSTKQMSVTMIGDTSLNTDFITGDDILGEDMTAREELVKSVNDVLKILTGSDDIPYFNENLDYYKDDFVIHNGVSYKFIYNHSASAWTGNDVEQTSLMAAYKELLTVVKTYTGVEELPEFSIYSSYSKDDIVTYNNILWRFTSPHSAGVWNGTDVEQTSLVREYLRLTKSTDEETVQIHVTKQDTLASKTNFSNCQLTLSVDGSTKTITTDENGNAADVVSDGSVYTISCSPLEGYALPSAITRTAQLNNYYISFNYLNNSLAPVVYEYPYCTIFSTDFTQTDPALWGEVGYEKTPIGVVLKTPVLQKNNLSFLIRFQDIIRFNTNTNMYEKYIITKQWQSGNGLLSSNFVPTTTDTATACNSKQVLYVTENIVSKAGDLGQIAPAADYALHENLIINDVSYGHGYLGCGLQTVQMLLQEGLISQCVNKVFGINISFTNNSPRIWTNVQYNATNAWLTYGASLGYSYYGTKTNSTGVVPFFAVPSAS